MGRLDGKVCVITGAGSGIGRASASLFVSEGGRVVVADVDLEAAQGTVEAIGAAGEAVAEQVDVTDEAQTVAMAERVVRRFEGIDALLPGTILTPFVERYLKDSYADPEEGMAAIRKRQLTNDLGRPEDVAGAALYLASDESRFVMATGLVVDGGVSGTK